MFYQLTNHLYFPNCLQLEPASSRYLVRMRRNRLSKNPSFHATFSSSALDDPSSVSGKINFQVATDSGFTSVISSGSSSIGLTNGQTGSWTSGYASFSIGTYYWRAQAEETANNNLSSWSSSKTMIVVTLDTPVTGDTNVLKSSPSLYATFASSALDDPSSVTGKMNFQIATDSGFSSVISSGSSSTGLTNGQTGSWSSPYGSFVEGTTYYWRAQVQEIANNNLSAWSSSKNMTIIRSLDKPTTGNISVLAKSPSFSSIFSASQAPDPSSVIGKINFQIATDSGFASVVSSGSSSTGLTNGQTGSWTSPYASFSPGTYYWRAQNEDSNSNKSLWSDSKTMTVVTLDAPTLSDVNVLAKSPSLSGNFSASQVTDPSVITGQVHFIISADTEFVENIVSSGSSSTGLTNGQTGSWTSPYGSFVEGTYYWAAQNEDSNGNASSLSDYKTMTVVTLDTPVTGDTSVSKSSPGLYVTFSASQLTDPSAVTGKVNFQIATDSGFTNVLSSGSSSTGLTNGQTGSWTSPYALFEEGGTYYWRAQNEDSYGNQSSWSNAKVMSIICNHDFCETFQTNDNKGSDTNANWINEAGGKISKNIIGSYVESSVSNGYVGINDNMISFGDYYPLPFSFPYYGNLYDSVYASQYGTLSFGEAFNSTYTDLNTLINSKVVAIANSETIYQSWAGIYEYQLSDEAVAFTFGMYNNSSDSYGWYEIILNKDGNIQFNFGDIPYDYGFTSNSWMGISKGDSSTYLTASLKDAWIAQPGDLSNGPSLLFTPTDIGRIADSIKINSGSKNITKATLNKTDMGTVNYYLSNDGGTTWESVTPGTEHTFSSTGNDLRWKAELIGGEVYSINVDWTEEPDAISTPTSPIDNIVSAGRRIYSSITPGTNGELSGDTNPASEALDYLKKARESSNDPKENNNKYKEWDILKFLIIAGGLLLGTSLIALIFKRYKGGA